MAQSYTIFIDFQQALDTVNRPKIYENLKMLKIPTNIIRLVKTTLTNSRAVVEVHQGRRDVFNINSGLRQGDALSTVLFNLVLEAAFIKKLKRKHQCKNKITMCLSGRRCHNSKNAKSTKGNFYNTTKRNRKNRTLKQQEILTKFKLVYIFRITNKQK